MKRILALDLSKRSTGWAIGYGNGFPLARSVSFTPSNRGGVFAQYMAWLRDRLLTNDPDLVVYEAPIMSARAKGSTDTLMILMGMAAITEAVCSMKAVTVVSVAVPTWRKAFLGHGFPYDPKAEAKQMCGLLRWEISNTDESDACGVWAWGHLNHGDVDAMRDQLSRAKVREMEGTTT